MKPFPTLAVVQQEFPRPRVSSIDEATGTILATASLPKLAGKQIAVAVGSRGITDLSSVVGTIIRFLKEKNAQPFIVPAMGSHGGATARGQSAILSGYGVNSSRMGAPVRASMETVTVGTSPRGIPVAIDRLAFESDGIILINRIKPHTDFKGTVGSGLMKMIAVGLGNRVGADSFHSWTLRVPYEELIQAKAEILLETGKVLFGIAVLENAYHETAALEFLPARDLVRREKELLQEASRLMPTLPVDQADLLIIDQIGKDISGSGMDPNVTGRWFRLNSVWADQPNITRIVVLDLTRASHGNACGMGLADFCGPRLIRKLDPRTTNLNAVTSRNIVASHTPLYFDSDRQTLGEALKSLASDSTPENVRLIRIRDTLCLDRLEASAALLQELREHPRVRDISGLEPMRFDADGNLTPRVE
jgi:hypothetical protein